MGKPTNVTREQIKLAKQMDLLTYLQYFEPDELLELSNGVYTTKTHDSLKVSNGKWCWWSKNIGGRSALDYLIKVRGMDFVRAVRWLCECARADKQPQRVVRRARPKSKPKELELPQKKPSTVRITAYLKSRGIDEEIIRFCVETGRLYQDKHNNCVFVGVDEDGEPRSATMRSTSAKSKFTGDAKGSDKLYTFMISAEPTATTLYVFESAIDLLSYLTIVKEYGIGDWHKFGNCLSLSGIYRSRQNEPTLPKALERYLRSHTDITEIVLCLDNDEAGRLAAHGIMQAMPSEYAVRYEPPGEGKDYNEQLMKLRNGIRDAHSVFFSARKSEEER